MLNQATVEKFHQFVASNISSDDESLLERVGAICQKVDPDLQTLLTYDAIVRKGAVTLRDCHEDFTRGQLPESDWHKVTDACRALITAVATDGWLEGYIHATGVMGRATH